MHVFLVALLVGGSVLVSGCDNATVDELREENEQLRQELEEAREEASSLQRGRTIEVLSADIYFKSGSAELTTDGVNELREVASRIHSEFPDRRIRIEGHTDSRPVGGRLTYKFPSNWELSAARATRVARHFRWTHDVNPQRLEPVGLASHHPIASNQTAEGRQQNRRVRVAVLVTASSGGE